MWKFPFNLFKLTLSFYLTDEECKSAMVDSSDFEQFHSVFI